MKLLTFTLFTLSIIFTSCGEATEPPVSANEPEEMEEIIETEEETPGPIEAVTNELSMDTVFSGANVYVQNPYSNTGVGFCVKQVWVNGESAEMSVDTDSFEINL